MNKTLALLIAGSMTLIGCAGSSWDKNKLDSRSYTNDYSGGDRRDSTREQEKPARYNDPKHTFDYTGGDRTDTAREQEKPSRHNMAPRPQDYSGGDRQDSWREQEKPSNNAREGWDKPVDRNNSY